MIPAVRGEGSAVMVLRLPKSVLAALAAVALAAATSTPPAVAATPAAAARSSGELDVGSRGRIVRGLQRRLGVPTDGVYGRRTARAVRRFQRRRALPATGRVDAVTRAALGLGEPTPAPTTSTGGTPSPDDVQSMVAAARSVLGRPYRAAAAGPDAFDCSGLVVWAARAAGLEVPRSSFGQYDAGTPITREEVNAGDLVFFDTAGPGASDVGIATSPTTAISATTHGVREHDAFGVYWGEHFVGARRLD